MVASLFVVSGAFLAVAALERLRPLRFAPSPFLRPHLATDAAWYVVATGSGLLASLLLRPLLEPLVVDPVAAMLESLPAIARVAAAVVVYDAIAFTVHRALHRSDRLWEFHKVHHSSLQLDWLATTRTHLAEHGMRNIPAQLALVTLGFDARTLAVAVAVYVLFALLGHSNLALPLRWAEVVFITPRLHRIHHVPATTVRNLGTVLSVWDRLAGTLVRVDTDPATATGVPGEVDTYPQRFADAFPEPFRRLRRLRSLGARPAPTAARR